jgi:hypothetical protein
MLRTRPSFIVETSGKVIRENLRAGIIEKKKEKTESTGQNKSEKVGSNTRSRNGSRIKLTRKENGKTEKPGKNTSERGENTGKSKNEKAENALKNRNGTRPIRKKKRIKTGKNAMTRNDRSRKGVSGNKVVLN